MNSQSTSRIVIGLGMAVVVGVGASVFVVRAKNESAAALSKPMAATPIAQPAPDQLAANPTPSAAPDQAALNTPAPVVAPAIVAQNSAPSAPSSTAPNTGNTGVSVSSAAPSDAMSASVDKPQASDKHVAKSRSTERSTRVASAANSSDKSAAETASAQPPPSAQNRQEADPQQSMTNAAPAASTLPVTSDTQITTEVKSEIAATGTNSNVDVKTTDGVVAIAGSAPSQDAVDQMKQAAQRVAGVKHVDTSTMTVANP